MVLSGTNGGKEMRRVGEVQATRAPAPSLLAGLRIPASSPLQNMALGWTPTAMAGDPMPNAFHSPLWTGRREILNIHFNGTKGRGFESLIGLALERFSVTENREGKTESRCLNPLLSVSRMFPTLPSAPNRCGASGLPCEDKAGEEGETGGRRDML